ncbi:5'-deoxyadenosine deaminase [Stigmatella hybrida]|uniref:5'-deoxyadenosine deaminase n=1 Tax=Stigmatella hybrida TaxID=394097 RepID=UPI001CDAA04F|nr:5'-deoxyadenosine deaminase [Stigmatella hybrida]
MDLLLTNGTVVTMNREREVLVGADVFIQDGRIARIGRGLKVGGVARRTLDVTGQVVMPGLIHGHIHACQTLFRNHADGMELLDWLRERIWPFEAAHDADSMRASADLTFAELIQSGATAALDMGSVRHYDAVFESARDCGFRLTGGKAMMDAGQGLPAGLRETTKASLAESVALLERWHGTHGDRLRYAFAPRFVLSCSEPLLKQVAHLAREKGVRVHTHASENATECDVVRQRVGQDNVAYFHSLGLTGPHVTLAHCVWLTAEEQRLLRETGTVVCHCPSSNLKLASGIAKVPELMDAGVHVCLGADGAPCNNNLDLFVEMRLAALLHKPRVGPLAMPALRVLEMATLEGARALGLEAEVGSLEVGKRADVTVVDLRGLHVTPVPRDVMGALVHAARSTDVSHVVIDGRLVLKDGKLLTLDPAEVADNARRHASRIVEQVNP